MHRIAVVTDVGTYLKQEADRKLADIVGSIYRYVHNRDALCFGILIIYYVIFGSI